MRPSILPAAALLLLALAACSDDPAACLASYAEGGDASVACLEDPTALDSACYDPPQICPGFAGWGFCDVEMGSSTTFSLVLLNRGAKPMTIQSVKVRGDTRCSVYDLQVDPPVGGQVEGGDSAILQFRYAPTTVGPDHVDIEVTTDAENFPVLNFPICGNAIEVGAPPADVCLNCVDVTASEYTECPGA